jgi:hypothetical protein
MVSDDKHEARKERAGITNIHGVKNRGTYGNWRPIDALIWDPGVHINNTLTHVTHLKQNIHRIATYSEEIQQLTVLKVFKSGLILRTMFCIIYHMNPYI